MTDESKNKGSPIEELFKSLKTFGDISMSAECRDKLYRYNDALMQSLYSIVDDRECSEEVKMEYLDTTLEQFSAAMKELFPKLISGEVHKDNIEQAPKACPIGKSDPNRFDEIEEVEKFNPYHDAKGRFSTASGFTSFTTRTRDPSKQHMADMAIAREKDRVSGGGGGTPKKNKNPNNDPETIGGVKRGDPMTREQADNSSANPNYAKSRGYQVNCQSCVVAYEARLRGYNVQAKANDSGNKAAHVLSRKTELGWIDPATGKNPNLLRNSEVTTSKKCKKWIEETVQQGERYTFEHAWKGRGRSGHIISVDRDSGGNLRFYDPQNGKTMQGADIDSYLNRTKVSSTVKTYGLTPNGKMNVPLAGLLRVDNLQINPQYADGIMEATT